MVKPIRQVVEHIHKSESGSSDSAYSEVGISGLNYCFFIKTNNKKIHLDDLIRQSVDILVYLEKNNEEKIRDG